MPLTVARSSNEFDGSGEVVGNHVFWGASTFLPQPGTPVLLTAGTACSGARIRHILRVLACGASPSWKRGLSGVRVQPPGLRLNPTLLHANSSVSPVDRRGLLTASSSAGCHNPLQNQQALTDSLNPDQRTVHQMRSISRSCAGPRVRTVCYLQLPSVPIAKAGTSDRKPLRGN
jgi:hypothetical protein